MPIGIPWNVDTVLSIRPRETVLDNNWLKCSEAFVRNSSGWCRREPKIFTTFLLPLLEQRPMFPKLQSSLPFWRGNHCTGVKTTTAYTESRRARTLTEEDRFFTKHINQKRKISGDRQTEWKHEQAVKCLAFRSLWPSMWQETQLLIPGTPRCKHI